jgi:hypothetical protein
MLPVSSPPVSLPVPSRGCVEIGILGSLDEIPSSKAGRLLRVIFSGLVRSSYFAPVWSSAATDAESVLVFYPPLGVIPSGDCPMVSSVHFPCASFPLVGSSRVFFNHLRERRDCVKKEFIDYYAN